MAYSLTVAVPVLGEQVSPHFGHPECFAFFSVDLTALEILGERRRVPPPHEPGRLPVWLAEQGAEMVLAGGIGQRAVKLLRDRGIDVVSGVPALSPSEAVRQWLAGAIRVQENPCGTPGMEKLGRCHD
jgi:predicted Fe-Mo cluster-binding NifX family protein